LRRLHRADRFTEWYDRERRSLARRVAARRHFRIARLRTDANSVVKQ